MKRFFFIASLIFIPTLLGAKNIELSVAHKAAQNFWQNTLEQRGHLSAIPYSIEGLYLFSAPQGGFVVMSSNDAVRPLLAYATHGTIDTDNLPIQLVDLLKWYSSQI
ncbi:MAG: Spi family protease inhibitor, partial [Bacteroidales bacterium]|nr:Spi family protease inhibitor [Bacteroidales bacterium]